MTKEKPFVQVRLKKGFTALRQDHKTILKCLGFRRREQVLTLPDTPEVRGALRKVSYLVEEESPHAS